MGDVGGGRRRKEAFYTSCFLPAASLVSFHMAPAEKEGRGGGTEEADSFRPYASGGGGDDRMPIPNSIDERASFVPFQVHDPLLPPERRRLPRRLHQVALHDHAPVGGVPEGKVDAGGKIGVLNKYPGMLLQVLSCLLFQVRFSGERVNRGFLKEWTLMLHGTREAPYSGTCSMAFPRNALF